jgi:hypothetical protein
MEKRKVHTILPLIQYSIQASFRRMIGEPFLKYGTQVLHHLNEALDDHSLNMLLGKHIIWRKDWMTLSKIWY